MTRAPRGVPPAAPAGDVAAAVARAARHEAPRALATLTGLLGDVGEAEDAVQEALAVALHAWRDRGVPDNVGAWLTTTARNRAYDRVRRESRRRDKELAAVREQPPAVPEVLHPVADDQLRMLFTCAHPALGPEAQLTLMLRLVCGLSTEQIARSCLAPVATVAQRLTRAKRKIREARVPFRIPEVDQLPTRLPIVLAAIEQVFTRGYAPIAGPAVVDVDLCDEGLRLARLLVELSPVRGTSAEGDSRALLGLFLLQDSRRAARADASGRLVRLADQDRDSWDRAAIAAGLAELDRAVACGARGPYLYQAIIAAEHARAPSFGATRWDHIVLAYDRLLQHRPTPVVALNRAVAVAGRDGPAAGLALVEGLASDRRLAHSHRVDAVRADLLQRLGRATEAAEACRRALALAPPGAERDDLADRLARLVD